MDKYIKLSDLNEMIDNYKKQENNDHEEGKTSIASHVAIIGTLETLRIKINS